MFATVRRYVDLPEPVVQRVIAVTDEVGALLASAPGFCDLRMVRTREGLLVVLTGTDEGALVECGRRFVAWVDARVEGFRGGAAIEIWAGDATVAALVADN